MITNYRANKNSRLSKKTKRISQTEPTFQADTQQQQQAVKAKNYLMSLHKNEDTQLYQLILKRRSEMDISLSQWNNQKIQPNKLNSRVAVSLDTRKLQQSERFDQKLCAFEISLIERQGNNNPITIRNANLSQFSNRVRAKKLTLSAQQKVKSYKKSSIQQVFEVCLPKQNKANSFCVKHEKLMKKEARKVDISYIDRPENIQQDLKNKERHALIKNKLPRLDHLQGQMYKNKYKSVFKQEGRKKTLHLPLHSPISREIIQIYDLIREESIKLIKHPL